ncbi:MAG: amphi-Trp domain-containing protein [Acidobacteria bacterium]|nr:amphi-Trp domain-containing protein [Acidobacteriota bacterium]
MARGRARDIEQAYTVRQFVAKLRRVADCLERGRAFTVQVGGERLRVPRGATWSIEHERGGGVEELEFQVRWEAP